MKSLNVYRSIGKTRSLAAVVGAGAVVVMGALAIGHAADETGPRLVGSEGWAQATVTKSTGTNLVPTPFAKPTYIAVPCGKRETMPCG